MSFDLTGQSLWAVGDSTITITVFTNQGVLYQAALTGSKTQLVAPIQATVNEIWIANLDSVSHSVQLYLGGSGDHNALFPPVTLDENEWGHYSDHGWSFYAADGSTKGIGADGVDATAPTAAIIGFGTATAPTDWLKCDGTSYLRATYPTLFAVIGTTYGAADGSHFSVPDLHLAAATLGIGAYIIRT